MATASEIKRLILKKTNCHFFREGTNHEIWINPNTGKKFQIPRHPSKEVKNKTSNNIYKAAGLI